MERGGSALNTARRDWRKEVTSKSRDIETILLIQELGLFSAEVLEFREIILLGVYLTLIDLDQLYYILDLSKVFI